MARTAPIVQVSALAVHRSNRRDMFSVTSALAYAAFLSIASNRI